MKNKIVNLKIYRVQLSLWDTRSQIRQINQSPFSCYDPLGGPSWMAHVTGKSVYQCTMDFGLFLWFF